ncbi:alpha/beta hydrolase [Dasania marina]|uniref:alpha/beta fold hydrolase n=1 Tax=Dasania marina TaxID=471499 RepID=UPI0030DA28A2|tara:strand:+ start:46413 stop:47270 length:858 start_codon:yes stop_codon:yes gene_type:complete
MSTVQEQEQRFHVNGYQLAAKEWHAGAAIKVIALHGWLDNANSFDELAARLPQCHIIALDSPGHGYSDHKQAQATYNIWDDLLDILAVADALGWQQFHVMGHSRGGIMSVLLAAAMPERVQSLLLLDGVFPPKFDLQKSPQLLADFLKGYRKPDKKMPSYNTIDEAVQARLKAADMSEAAAQKIVERGVKKVAGLYTWVADPRLRMASAIKLSHEHVDAMMKAISMPALVLLAERGFVVREGGVERLQQYPQFVCELLVGGHHFHMEQQAADIAQRAQQFYSALV